MNDEEKRDNSSAEKEKDIQDAEARLETDSSKRDEASNAEKDGNSESLEKKFDENVKLGPFATPVGCYSDYSAEAKSEPLKHMDPKKLLLFVLEGGRIVLGPSIRGEIPVIVAASLVTCALLWLFLVPGEPGFGGGDAGASTATVLTLVNIALVPLCAAAYVVHHMFNIRAYITQEALIAESGRLSWRKRVVKLPHEKLKAVEVSSSVYGQLVNIGELRLSTPYFDQPEIVVPRIVDPSRYRPLLEALIVVRERGLKLDDFVETEQEQDPLMLRA